MRILIISVLCFLVSCANQAVDKMYLIDHGGSKKDVVDILGPPQNRQFKEKNEAWQYCQTEFVSDSFVMIWFYDGKVTGVNTYRDSVGDIGFCTSHFRQVKWEDAPNISIELRSR